MPKFFSIPLAQVVDDKYAPDDGLSDVKLVNQDDSSEVALSDLGDGAYGNDAVPSGTYKLFVGEVEITKWGGTNGRWIGDEALPYMGDDGDGHWQGEDKRLHNIADPVSGIDVGDRDYNDGRYLQKSGGTMTGNINMGGNDVTNSGNLLDKSSVQSFTGKKSSTDTAGIDFFVKSSPTTEYPRIIHLDGETEEYRQPPTDLSIATKKFVTDQVAGITVPPNPFSSIEVQVVANATQVTGIKYNTILNAANYLDTLSLGLARRGVVNIRPNPSTSYYIAASGSLKNYQNWNGYGAAYITSAGEWTAWNNLGTIVVVCEGSGTYQMTIKDCTLIFGNSTAFVSGNSTGARAYQGLVLNNCVIFAYNDTTFNSCVLNNCYVIHSGSYKATLNNCVGVGNYFSNEPVVPDTNTPILYSGGSGWPNIPNDITAYIPS